MTHTHYSMDSAHRQAATQGARQVAVQEAKPALAQAVSQVSPHSVALYLTKKV